MNDDQRKRHHTGEDAFVQSFTSNGRRGLLVAPFAIAIIIFIATLLLGIHALEGVHESSKAVAETYSIKAALEHVLTTILDAETGERGFILTGMESFLAPYDR